MLDIPCNTVKVLQGRITHDSCWRNILRRRYLPAKLNHEGLGLFGPSAHRSVDGRTFIIITVITTAEEHGYRLERKATVPGMWLKRTTQHGALRRGRFKIIHRMFTEDTEEVLLRLGDDTDRMVGETSPWIPRILCTLLEATG